ncbi:MAG: LptF/LptG family permease [Candidatus Omnitrophica bacterium]|nr:LptF/LptG family permease [Candidatus Omnitrophota bacterium]
MRILDRYILKSTLGLFFGCLFLFIFLYVIIDLFGILKDILEHKTPLRLVIEYYLLFLPVIFVQVSPIACLISTLYTFGKLNRTNEIIAMRASGLSIFQISKTVIIFGAIVSMLIFWVNDTFVPHSLAVVSKIKKQVETGHKPQNQNQAPINNLAMYGVGNRLFFINKFVPANNTMEGIIILEQDEKQNITRKILANTGEFKNNMWRFYQSITYNFSANGQIKGEPQFLESEIMTFPETPQDFLTQRQRPEFMNIAELDNYLWKLSKSGATTAIRSFKVDLYQRFAFPFTTLIITLLAIPFSLMIKKRAAVLSSVGVALLVGFLYYVFNEVGIALGKAGVLAPLLSAFASHLIAFITALLLITALP